jgi:hypothetical protein
MGLPAKFAGTMARAASTRVEMVWVVGAGAAPGPHPASLTNIANIMLISMGETQDESLIADFFAM